MHALAYPLGARFHLPHGLSNALMLPTVMRFNLVAAAATYAELLPWVFPSASLQGGVQEQAAELVAGMEALIARVGLPRRLRDVGIDEADIPMLAADAVKQTRLLVNNPRVVELQDATDIYRQAW